MPSGAVDLVEELRAALAPRYDVHGTLGRGGFGTVFRAMYRNTKQDVAIKVLRLDPGWSSAMVTKQIARFERETELCAGLQHPNIVRLLDKGRTRSGLCYAIYELVPGETLRSVLDRGPLSMATLAEQSSQEVAASGFEPVCELYRRYLRERLAPA